jgi:anti-sigma factor ChrR (cupin superfamily)
MPPAAGAAPAAGASQEATQVWRRWTSAPEADGVFTLRAEETGWEKTDIAGIEVRNLFADRERNYVTMLVRMAPGTAYPTHRHAGVEECFVLDGDLRVPPGRHLHAGDYQRAAGDSLHGIQSTDEGCLLFIVSSTEDELV